jgi:hypothetical protein
MTPPLLSLKDNLVVKAIDADQACSWIPFPTYRHKQPMPNYSFQPESVLECNFRDCHSGR